MMNSPILPVLTIKLVAMATFLEPPEKGCQIGNLRPNTYLPYGKNVVKIGPVDTEMSLLSLFKKEKEIHASRT